MRSVQKQCRKENKTKKIKMKNTKKSHTKLRKKKLFNKKKRPNCVHNVHDVMV